MKKCVYCGGDIPDLARKCPFCHSFQSPSDEPKKPTDIATLVIQFVGSVTTAAALAVAVVGYIGFKNISDMNDQVGKMKIVVSDTETRLKRFDDTSLLLNALSIREAYARFDSLMESLSISELYKTPGLWHELNEIAETVAHIDKVADGSEAESLRHEIISEVSSVKAYLDGRFEDAANAIASTVPDSRVRKHLLLVAAYTGLFNTAKAKGELQSSGLFLEKAILEAKSAVDAARKSNRQLGDAQINLAVTLIYRNGASDLDDAFTTLQAAKKTSLKLSIIDYDIAGLYVRKHQLDEALTSLEEAKSHGDLSSNEGPRCFLWIVGSIGIRSWLEPPD
jgi:tetratricopeptide (TPR) repeat protein